MISLILLLLSAPLSSAQDWKIELQLPKLLKPATDTLCRVKLADAKGAPVEGAQVELVLTMVDMDHGETKVAAKPVKAGLHEGKVRFLMSGEWNIEVRVRKAAQTAAKNFRYKVQ